MEQKVVSRYVENWGVCIYFCNFELLQILHIYITQILSGKVSSQECVNISSLIFNTDNIWQSILNIMIDIEKIYNESCKDEIFKLNNVIDIEIFQTLMIFGLKCKIV